MGVSDYQCGYYFCKLQVMLVSGEWVHVRLAGSPVPDHDAQAPAPGLRVGGRAAGRSTRDGMNEVAGQDAETKRRAWENADESYIADNEKAFEADALNTIQKYLNLTIDKMPMRINYDQVPEQAKNLLNEILALREQHIEGL